MYQGLTTLLSNLMDEVLKESKKASPIGIQNERWKQKGWTRSGPLVGKADLIGYNTSGHGRNTDKRKMHNGPTYRFNIIDVTKYTGEQLREIRRRKTNFKGEPQR